jgi:hypothetical protein
VSRVQGRGEGDPLTMGQKTMAALNPASPSIRDCIA